MKTSRKRKQPRRRPRFAWLGVPVAGMILGGGLALAANGGESSRWLAAQLRAPRFALRAVEFLGLETINVRDLFERSGINGSLPLIDLDLDAIEERVCTHPRLVSCVAARIPPNRLVIEVEERVPVARLSDGRGVDLEGARFPLAQGEGVKLTVLEGPVDWALPFLAAARAAGVELAEVEARAATDIRFRPKGQAMRVLVGPEPAASLRDWLRLRDTSLLRGYAAREVDLRFRGSAVLRDFRKSQRGEEDGSE